MESYQPQSHSPQTNNLFEDLENELVQASQGKRFANYLIDILTFYAFLFGIGVLAAVTGIGLDFIDALSENGLLGRLFSLVLYGIYMGSIEAIFDGMSLGKLITGTRAVNEDGSRLSAGTAFIRGLSRSVPFEAFSALGTLSYPWHDKWTDTYVIETRK